MTKGKTIREDGKDAALAVSDDRLSRARATRKGREERVQTALAMMTAGTFVKGKTYRELAERWRMHPTTASDICSEAWRRHGAEINDPHRVRVKLATILEDVLDDAFVETRDPAMIDGGSGKDGERRVYQESPNGARKIVIDAAKTLGALVGTTDLVVPRDWTERSIEERWAAIDRAQARIDAIRAGMPPREEIGEGET